MRAGRRDKRVELQSKAIGDDGMGGGPETWTTYATVWAYIDPTGGSERYASQQLQAAVSTVIGFLHRSDVTAAHRAKYGTKVFKIHAVLNPRTGNKETVLHCEEVPA